MRPRVNGISRRSISGKTCRPPLRGDGGPFALQQAGHGPQMFAGVVEVHQFAPRPEMLGRQRPDPAGAIRQHQHVA